MERFLQDIGVSPAESSSRNPLEQPWALAPEELARRARNAPLKPFAEAREETASLTERIDKIEREIDDRVAGLYGL